MGLVAQSVYIMCARVGLGRHGGGGGGRRGGVAGQRSQPATSVWLLGIPTASRCKAAERRLVPLCAMETPPPQPKFDERRAVLRTAGRSASSSAARASPLPCAFSGRRIDGIVTSFWSLINDYVIMLVQAAVATRKYGYEGDGRRRRPVAERRARRGRRAALG